MTLCFERIERADCRTEVHGSLASTGYRAVAHDLRKLYGNVFIGMNITPERHSAENLGMAWNNQPPGTDLGLK